jgi:hypothetical protein
MKQINFEVGEWVISSSWANTKPRQITKIELATSNDEEDFVFFGDNCCVELKYIEKWIPKEGEWCWFYTNKLTIGRIVSPILKQYKKGDERMIMERLIRNNKFVIDDKHVFYELELLEPWTGELPSVLKELNES